MTREEVLKAVATAHRAGKGVDLTGVNLTGADLTNMNLPRAYLNDADLTDADLTHADLWDANLESADLTGANLYGAGLTDANLQGADLTGVNLHVADLWGANLTGANLHDADLSRAKLIDANLPPSAFMNPTITDEQWAAVKIGPTRATGDRLKDMHAAATTTDLTQLKKYARAGAIGVRMAAASNQACPEELLLKLISDKREEVRRTVLANPNCGDSVRVMAALQS